MKAQYSTNAFSQEPLCRFFDKSIYAIVSTMESSEITPQRAIAKWLQSVMDSKGWTPPDWHKASGVAASTIQRAVRNDYKFITSTKTLRKLADAAGVPLPLFDGGSQNRDHGHSAYGSIPSASVNYGLQKSPLQSLRVTHNVTIKGRVKAGTWKAMKEYDQDLGSVPFYAPQLRGKKLYGLIVEGQSVNLKYPEGTTVIIADIYDRRPKNRDFVVIRNYIAVDIAEMTLKQAIKGSDGIIRYFCYSDDPEYKDAEPIIIPPRDEFAQLGYEVIGSVVGSMPRYEESDEEELFDDNGEHG